MKFLSNSAEKSRFCKIPRESQDSAILRFFENSANFCRIAESQKTSGLNHRYGRGYEIIGVARIRSYICARARKVIGVLKARAWELLREQL